MSNYSTFFHVLWRCLFVFAVFVLCIPHSSDGNEELEYTLRCALRGKFDEKCRLEGPELKPDFLDLLKRSPAPFRSILRGQVKELKPTLIAKIPPTLVYLLPEEVWSRVEPTVAFEMIKSHKRNEAVCRSVMRGYAKATLSDKKDFLIVSDFNALDHSIVSMMASEVSLKWTIDDDTLIGVSSATFFAALPAPYILEMDKSQQSKMINEITRWKPTGLNKDRWFDLPTITERVWAIISRNYSWTGSEKRTTSPFLAGATPSELQQDGKFFSEYDLMQLPLKNRMQIRALFPIVRPEDELSRFDLTLLKNWFLLLSPDQILRFKDDLDIMYVVKEKKNEYWSYPKKQEHFALPSVPTLRQIIEITTMVNNERQVLPLDLTKWGDEISIFGPLAFLIGARRLGRLHPDHNALGLHTLREIDSYHFSKRMARHLMFNCAGKVILKVKGLLRGVSTRRLFSLGEYGIKERDHLSENAQISPVDISDRAGLENLREIVQNIPADVPARSALVFRKLRENLGGFNNLEAVLRNPYPEQFLSLLTFKETETVRKTLSFHWTRVMSENLVDRIHLLPDSVLSNLLGAPTKHGIEHNPNGRLESKSLGGLTCEHLLAVPTSNIPEIILAMRHARKRAGKTEMSKKLQRCARIAMDKFLIERGSSTVASKMEVMALTASAISLADIENFGGFVLATFPPKDIMMNRYAEMIMKKIGSLSVYELISAIPCYKCLRKMAETAVQINYGERNITLSHLLDLGSLVGFLPTNLIGVIHPTHWKITAEAASLDGSFQPLCVDEESRDAWEKVIRSAFGAPEHWSADTLASIGSYMPALVENTLESVSLNERALAGDTMGITSGAPYLHGVEIIGYDHPRAFWKVCRDLLDVNERKGYVMAVHTAARFQLNSAQLFASKVKDADTLKELRAKKRKASTKSTVVTTETPPDLNERVDFPSRTIGTVKSTVIDTPWKFAEERTTQKPQPSVEEESQKPQPSVEEESQKPQPSVEEESKLSTGLITETPQPYVHKELDVSEDLHSFIGSFYNDTDLPAVGSVSGGLPNAQTNYSEFTGTLTEKAETAFSNLGVSEASVEVLRKESESPNKFIPSNSPSQVYVDQENKSLDKSDDPQNPSAGLIMKFNDFKLPTASTTLKPTKETNGTVFAFPNVSMASAEPPKYDQEPIPETTTVEAGDTMVVTSSPYLSNNSAGVLDPIITSSPQTLPENETSKESVTSTTPSSYSYLSSSASNLYSSTGVGRRRREINVQAFETQLTCDGLLTMGPAAALALSLSDVDMAYEDIEDCVEFIGELELPKEVAKTFWKKLKMAAHWDTIGDVGCLAAGMSTDDVEHLNLDINGEHVLDTITAVSTYADKDVVKSMITKLGSRLDAEFAEKGKVALAEEITLALGLDICLLPEGTRSYLVNTPNVLPRSLSGLNRKEFFERSPCQSECLRDLLNALINQKKPEEWTSDDSRNAGVLVAGFSEEQLKRMSSAKTLQPFAEISGGAVRCLSDSQLMAMHESFIWWSPVAAGALSEEKIRILSEEQKRVLQHAIFGRPGISSSEESVLTGAATDLTPNMALTAVIVILVVKCYVLSA